MSDSIKHECGIALIRLKKPLEYYHKKYGTRFYGLDKLYLLMQKQHNRGQDGAGVVAVKLDVKPGEKYISRMRSLANNPIQDIFDRIYAPLSMDDKREKRTDMTWLGKNFDFQAELILGHLRYGTFGKNDLSFCHPFMRQNNWRSRNLAIAGNFNMTNVDELFDILVDIGQHPKEKSDTITVLEKIGHYLDEENEELFKKYKSEGATYRQISELIAKNIDIPLILKNAASDFDGGYVIAGIIGHGDAFVFRDPNGIRPVFYYNDDEILVVTSERPAIQTSLNIDAEKIKEITPGAALIIKRDGAVKEHQILEKGERKSCSFERIYFSRGSDVDIYKERKKLGELLTPIVLEKLNYDIDNTVFSFIPNTAEVSFYGLTNELNSYLNKQKLQEIQNTEPVEFEKIISKGIRVEKIAIKDMKLRTFITQDSSRDDLVTHVYDVTYGTVRAHKDTLVIIDDSIVRGTTLKNSIIKMLDRLKPKKIIILSSAPQIRYPDCYGIDMAKLGDFIAFQAVIALLKDASKMHVLDEVYKKCKDQERLPKEQIQNYVKEIYDHFTADEISQKISHLLKTEDINAEIEVVYQTIENLHTACPEHMGDWYFTGNYPTYGGNKVVNKAFINYMEGKNERAY